MKIQKLMFKLFGLNENINQKRIRDNQLDLEDQVEEILGAL